MSRPARVLHIPAGFADLAAEPRAVLAERFSVSITTIIRWRKAVGIFQGRPTVPDDFADLGPTLTIDQAKAHYGVGERTIRRWRRERDIPPQSSVAAAIKARTLPIPDDLEERLRDLGTIEALTAHYDRSRKLIRRWLRDAGLRVDPVAAQSKRRVPCSARKAGPRASFVKPIPGRMVLVGGLGKIPPTLSGREQDAAQHLRRFYPAVYRCAETGRAEVKGAFWRVGNAVITPAELVARAHRKGWDPEEWRRVA